MKITGRNIKRRLYGLRMLPSKIKRARYFRGHGVHSPYVYSIVREVFMHSKLKHERHDLYDALIAIGINSGRAIELQNLMEHCLYSGFLIDCEPQHTDDVDMIIATLRIPHHDLATMAKLATEQHKTLCIMAPAYDKERDLACQAIVEQHPCTSVDNRGYLLLFNNHLPKQKFRL